jgi:hypothetical protein
MHHHSVELVEIAYLPPEYKEIGAITIKDARNVQGWGETKNHQRGMAILKVLAECQAYPKLSATLMKKIREERGQDQLDGE